MFFVNCQSQAGRLLFETTAKPNVKDLVRAFLFELHDRVIESGFYDGVARLPEAPVLLARWKGYAIATSSQDRPTADYPFLCAHSGWRAHRQSMERLWRLARNS